MLQNLMFFNVMNIALAVIKWHSYFCGVYVNKCLDLFIFQIENVPSLLCEVNTKARLTCLAVWLKKDFETGQIPDEATPSSSQGITVEFS